MKDREQQAVDRYASVVASIARSAHNASPVVDIDDFKQIGFIAVIEAIRRFDVSSGRSLRNYIRQCIRRAIFKEAKKFYLFFRLPHDVYKLAARVEKLSIQGNSLVDIGNILQKENPKTDRVFDEGFVEKLLILGDLRKSNLEQRIYDDYDKD